ncbi:MAG: hypothetical protein KDI44_07600 [Thiothrix sp.]|nr:hypothetical protein [Thiothrix sp.]HPQ95801.1 hypothetical protein [Thiolinea sp.]
MDHYRIGPTVDMISPGRPAETARFDVAERPVLLEAHFCNWQDGFEVMRVSRICGNRIDTAPYEQDGQALKLSQTRPRLTITEPGRYILLSSNGINRTASVRRTTLGVQHA